MGRPQREFSRSLPAVNRPQSAINPIWPHAALWGVALIYGLNYTLAKDVMPDYLSPPAFILLRALAGAVLFQLTGLFFPREQIARAHWWRLVLGGFFGVAANQLLFFYGLNLTQPIQASVIMTSNPIIVLVLSAIFLKVPIRPLRVLGILLGLVGAVLLITRGEELHGLLTRDTSLGNLLVLLNAASFGTYLIITKPIMAQYRPITVIRWAFLFGVFFVLPLGLNPLLEAPWAQFPIKIWWEISFVLLATTYLAYLLNMFALKQVSSTTVSFYIYLQPVFATLAAVWLGSDTLTWLATGAALLIFAGVYLVSRPAP